jgi:tetratricopeptide (TPR) repeat protein
LGELSLTRRVRLHGRIAEALEAVYGRNADAHAAELARHFTEAESVLGTEKLVRYSALAGEQALARYAYEDAASHFARGLSARGDAPMDGEVADLCYGLGQAQVALAQQAEAAANLRRAFECYLATGNVGKAVTILQFPYTVSLVTLLTDLFPRALSLVPDGSLAMGRLLSNYGSALSRRGDSYEQAREALERAEAIAGRENDPLLQMRVMSIAAQVDGFHLRWRSSLEKGLKALELSSRVDEPVTRLRAHLWTALALRASGDFDASSSHPEQMLEVAEKLRDRIWIWRSLFTYCELAYARGEWETAKGFLDRMLEIAPFDLPTLAPRALVSYQTGNFTEGRPYLERVLQAAREPSAWERGNFLLSNRAPVTMNLSLLAYISGETDYLDITKSLAEAEASSAGVPPLWSLRAHIALGLIAVLRRDVEAAKDIRRRLKPQEGTFASGVGTLVSIDHMLGLLSWLVGDYDEANEQLGAAESLCRKAGAKAELAWVCCDYADMLLQRDGPGDRQKAMSLLDEALQISRELDMRPLMERVLSRRKILKA